MNCLSIAQLSVFIKGKMRGAGKIIDGFNGGAFAIARQG